MAPPALNDVKDLGEGAVYSSVQCAAARAWGPRAAFCTGDVHDLLVESVVQELLDAEEGPGSLEDFEDSDDAGGEGGLSAKYLEERFGELVVEIACSASASAVERCDIEEIMEEFFQYLSQNLITEFASKLLGNQDSDDGGSCELCEREMPLTRHHLIPKALHKEWLRKKRATQVELNVVAMVCRQCHNALHASIEKRELAEHYNTVDALLNHDAVRRFAAWASKQRSRAKADHSLKYSVHRR